MKKIFAIFCALCLMPGFSAQAWIGGPFGNNTYFGEEGDDGVYEAVAVPIGRARNGVGIYRWGVTNNFPGLDPTNTTTFTFGSSTGTDDFVVPVSGNVMFGGVSLFTHSWFLNGVYYRGFCDGTVNSGLGTISCIGAARSAAGLSGILESVSSGFRAQFSDRSNGIPIRRFEGAGRARTHVDSTGEVADFRFTVFGSKVANGVSYFGLN
jgi:hypothetical protein